MQASAERLFFVLSDIMHGILLRDGVVWTPLTKLAEIDGWNSNKTVTAMLALEKRIGRSLPADELDRAETVDDLVTLATTAGGPRTVAKPTQGANPFARFESLGESCEFGIVQQEFGIMQPHLLRFSSFIGDPAQGLARLTAALREDFERLPERELLDLRVPDAEWDGGEKEYRYVNTHYGWQIHTGLMVASHDIEAAKARLKDFPDSLVFLREKFLRELRLGRKVWIWKSAKPSPQRDVEALLDVLQRHGPNTLLWVLRADADHPPATVVKVRDNFFKAYIFKSDAQWSGDWSDSWSWRALIDAATKALPEPAPSSVGPQTEPAAAPAAGIADRQRDALAMLSEVVAAEVDEPGLRV
jgi:acyl carrier protein